MIINRFSPSVTKMLALSRETAYRLSSGVVTPEHMLIAMLNLHDKEMDVLLSKTDLQTDTVCTNLAEYSREHSHPAEAELKNVALNRDMESIIRLAVIEAHNRQEPVVCLRHFLLALLRLQTDSCAKSMLVDNGVDYNFVEQQMKQFTPAGSLHDDDVNTADNSLAPLDDEEDDDGDILFASGSGDSHGKEKATQTKQTKTPVLDRFATDLTSAAASGSLDPVVGREKEIERIVEILGRRKKNNPILIGEPGVGKTAIVEGLAQRIVARNVAPTLFNKRVISLDMASMVAGTKYRGQFEERMKAVLKELEGSNDIILFIDEIHTIIGAGDAAGHMDAANLLKPALARGRVQCIGSTTLDEYRNSIEKDGALERRFQKVMVEAPTAEETLLMLSNIKHQYELHHHVVFTDEALKACVQLTEQYVSDRQFPDKAIDAMDEAGSKAKLSAYADMPALREKELELARVIVGKKTAVRNQNYELAASYRDQQARLEQELSSLNFLSNQENQSPVTVDAEHVEAVVSIMTGIPVARIAMSETERLKNLSGILKQQVVAQDNAVETVVKAIQRNRMGLKDPNSPIGAFMFLGPTGVGKTYLAKQLALHLFGSVDALIRIDMSEYSESFNTSRLVGAPPGYVGYDEGGQLTERVRRHPYSIILLDEIEKAHPNVFNMLLQVLDEGRLTDGNGRLVNFKNTIIIMTSNAGTRQLKEFGKRIGFQTESTTDTLALTASGREHANMVIKKALSKQFSPEFLNRLDDIVMFEQLDMNAIKQIIDIELKVLYNRIEQMGFHLGLSEDAKEYVATQGYDIQYGARPLKRALKTHVEDLVCEKLFEESLPPGATIKIVKSEDEDKLIIQ